MNETHLFHDGRSTVKLVDEEATDSWDELTMKSARGMPA